MPSKARLATFAALLGLIGGLPMAASAADADAIVAIGNTGEDEFLHPDVAFRVTATATAPDRIEVSFQVHPGYYLYRGKMKFVAAEGQPAALGTPDLPAGEKKVDEYFGEQEVYHHDVTAKLPVSRGS